MKYRANTEEHILLGYHHIPGVHSIQVYENAGGYKSLKDSFNMSPLELRELIHSSGLRERGGKGFPTGTKWKLFSENPILKKYIICNAHERGQSAHKDCHLLDVNPHLLIEGMVLAARALGVDKGYIFIRHELSQTISRLEVALEEAYKKHYLGRNIIGEGFNFDLFLHHGAGAEMSSDESLIFSALEGKLPTPPVMGEGNGYRQFPTMVHYSETLANLPWIVSSGADAFRKWGTERSPGTKLFSLSGDVNKPGVYELPLGIPLEQVIEKYGEGIKDGSKLKLVLPAGTSSTPLTETQVAKTNLDYETLSSMESQLGPGGIIVLSEGRDIEKVLQTLLQSYREGSCGDCTPCREGIVQIERLFKNKTEKTLDTISLMASNIKRLSACSYGEDFAMPIQGLITSFRNDIINSGPNLEDFDE